MNTRNVRHVSLIALAVSAALGPGAAWSQDASPQQQSQAGDEAGEELGVITVTGSRTINEAEFADADHRRRHRRTGGHDAERHRRRAEQAAADHRRAHSAHARQRQHQQRRQPLSLRNFGPRAPWCCWTATACAENQDGTVNIDTLPQMLVEPRRHRDRRRFGDLRFRRRGRRGQLRARQGLHRPVGEG